MGGQARAVTSETKRVVQTENGGIRREARRRLAHELCSVSGPRPVPLPDLRGAQPLEEGAGGQASEGAGHGHLRGGRRGDVRGGMRACAPVLKAYVPRARIVLPPALQALARAPCSRARVQRRGEGTRVRARAHAAHLPLDGQLGARDHSQLPHGGARGAEEEGRGLGRAGEGGDMVQDVSHGWAASQSNEKL
jgi:hypothetical protein